MRKGQIINVGKRFEEQIKKSIPSYCLYHRLNDGAGSFSGGENLRFTSKNPCDCFLFDSHSSIFFTLELKSTKNSSISYEDITIEESQPKKMIHKHQILSLQKYSQFDRVCSGFIFNFRDDKNNIERTYFQNIKDFLLMTSEINKKSFNEKDLLNYSPIIIEGTKKRINYTWNIDNLLKKIGGLLND